MPPIYRDDPYAAFNFELIVTGISNDPTAVKGSFMEVSGLGVEITPIEYRVGSEDITVRKLPGLKKYTNLVLKWGVTGDVTLWKWILDGLNGVVANPRPTAAVILLDENRSEVMRWNFRRVWPCKYTGPGLNAKNNEIAIETLEIAHEGVLIDT
jgi:phage tail-like protein